MAFIHLSNVPFNNAPFSAWTIVCMHPSLARLYEAAKSLPKPVSGKSAVAAWLVVSPQMVNNWEKRGVSKAGALAAQDRTGYSARWILEGTGEKMAADRREKGAFLNAVTPEEQELLDHFRHLLPSDRKAKIAEVAKLAAERDAQRKEMLEEAGVNRIMAGAAHASRKMAARTATRIREPDPNAPELPLFPPNQEE